MVHIVELVLEGHGFHLNIMEKIMIEHSHFFTKDFLFALQEKYSEGHKKFILDSLMNVHKLSFHDAILWMAKRKKMEPEYIKKKV